MAHSHPVTDMDVYFEIDAITRKIVAKSGKSALIQGDHNSERFSFRLPRIIDGHDMAQCNSVQVHYINVDSTTKEHNADVYEVEDMRVDAESEDFIILSWLISQNATKYDGSLSFLIKFKCVNDGKVDYVWNTSVYTGISISNGIDNGEAVETEYSDILSAWEARLDALEQAESVTSWNDLTDKPFGDDVIVVYGETVFTFSENDETTDLLYIPPIESDKEYIIVCDGKEYTVSVDIDDSMGIVYLGVDEEVPVYVEQFLDWDDSVNGWVCDGNRSNFRLRTWRVENPEYGDHTIGIYQLGGVKTLDEKYIPETIARVEDLGNGTNLIVRSHSKHLYSYSNVSNGGYTLDPNNSNVAAMEDYISIVPGKKYTVSRKPGEGKYFVLAWYDASKVFMAKKTVVEIDQNVGGSYTWTAPEGAYFLRISFPWPEESEAKLEEGSVATPWCHSLEDKARIGKNLIVRAQSVRGVSYSYSTNGEPVSNATDVASMITYIPIIPGKQYTVSRKAGEGDYFALAWYDANKAFIKKSNIATMGVGAAGQYVWTAPVDAYFLRVSFPWDEASEAKLEEGAYATPWCPSVIDEIEQAQLGNGENLIVRAQSISQYSYGATKDGNPAAYSSSVAAMTTYIATAPGKKYTFSRKAGGGNYLAFAWYDASKVFLGNHRITEIESNKEGQYTWTVPEDTYFFRVSFPYPAESKAKVEEGTVATPWCPSITDMNLYSRVRGKHIVYDGTSLTTSDNANGSYPKIIADVTEGTFTNFAKSGAILSSNAVLNSGRHSIVDTLPNLPKDADLYCFEGGFNDYDRNFTLGTYDPDDYTGEVDTSTACGALETIFRYALNNFTGKPVCFVIVHKACRADKVDGVKVPAAITKNNNGDTFKDYHDAFVGICKKYSIPYYDAFEESGLNCWNATQNALCMPDGLHPNETGYRKHYAPKILQMFERVMPIEKI